MVAMYYKWWKILQRKVMLERFCMIGKNFSRQHFEIVFSFFPENMLWHFMQIVS